MAPERIRFGAWHASVDGSAEELRPEVASVL